MGLGFKVHGLPGFSGLGLGAESLGQSVFRFRVQKPGK